MPLSDKIAKIYLGRKTMNSLRDSSAKLTRKKTSNKSKSDETSKEIYSEIVDDFTLASEELSRNLEKHQESQLIRSIRIIQ